MELFTDLIIAIAIVVAFFGAVCITIYTYDALVYKISGKIYKKKIKEIMDLHFRHSDYCYECGKMTKLNISKEYIDIKVKQLDLQVEMLNAKCSECNEYVFNLDVETENDYIIYSEYNRVLKELLERELIDLSDEIYDRFRD